MTDTAGPGPSDRYAPPIAALSDAPDSQGGIEIGGRWMRFWAALIDGLLQGIVGIPLMFLITGASWRTLGDPGHKYQLVGISIGVFIVLQGWLLATHGQTIGKKLLGLRIVMVDGSRVPFGRLIGLRYLPTTLLSQVPFVGWILGLVDACLIFRASRRTLHDEIAGTIVATAESTELPAAGQ
jgi:uncharacterized RDD family membrane protein YckC